MEDSRLNKQNYIRFLVLSAIMFMLCGWLAYTAESHYLTNTFAQRAEQILTETQIEQLMKDITDGTPMQARFAFNKVLLSRDRRSLPVFIELLRASEDGTFRNRNPMAYVSILKQLSGQNFGYDWRRWEQWYQQNNISLPPGFSEWQERLRARH